MKSTKSSAESKRGDNRRVGHVNEESIHVDHLNLQILVIAFASYPLNRRDIRDIRRKSGSPGIEELFSRARILHWVASLIRIRLRFGWRIEFETGK